MLQDMLFQTKTLERKRKAAKPHQGGQSCFLHTCLFQKKFVHCLSIKGKAKKVGFAPLHQKMLHNPTVSIFTSPEKQHFFFFTFSNLALVNVEPINRNLLSQHWCPAFCYLIEVSLPFLAGLSLISHDPLKQSSFYTPFPHIWVSVALQMQSHQKQMTTVTLPHLHKNGDIFQNHFFFSSIIEWSVIIL